MLHLRGPVSNFILLLFCLYIRASICFTNISICLFFVSPNKKMGFYLFKLKNILTFIWCEIKTKKKKNLISFIFISGSPQMDNLLLLFWVLRSQFYYLECSTWCVLETLGQSPLNIISSTYMAKFLFQEYINILEKHVHQKKKVYKYAWMSVFINTVFAKTFKAMCDCDHRGFQVK